MFAEVIRESLVRVQTAVFEVTHAKRLAEARRRLSRDSFAVVLLDLFLPDSLGLDTYAGLKQAAPALPIVAMTGSEDETLALEAVRLGAQDYVVKSQLESRTLARIIRYAIERRRAQEALCQSEEFFRLICENVADLVAVLDCDGRRLYNNRAYEPILGDPRQLVGSESFTEIHPEDRERVRGIFRQTVETGQGQRTQYRFQLRDGSVRYIESQGNAILDATGQPCKVVVVSRDVTARQQTEQQLREAVDALAQAHEQFRATQSDRINPGKLDALSALAAGMADEVKNPLQTLALAADYLGRQPSEHSECSTVLRDMNQAVQRIAQIMRGLIELAHGGSTDSKQGWRSNPLEAQRDCGESASHGRVRAEDRLQI